MPENVTSEPTLSPKQDMLISAMLAGNNIQTAAAAAKINEKTAYRWLKLSHVQQSLKAAQKSLFDQALTSLMLKVDKAIETLDRNMTGEEVRPYVQVQAASIILDRAIAIHKTTELEQKVAQLEALLKESGIK